MFKALFAVTLAFAITAPAHAAEPAAGTWKLDLAKSHFEGDTFTFSQLPGGKMHYSNGAQIQYDFAPDGQEYPFPFGGTVSVTSQDADHWDAVYKLNGKVLSTDHYALSSGGKILTIHSTGTRPDGSAIDDEATYARLSGTSGPDGKWRSTKVKTSAPGLSIISFPSSSTIKWEIPDYKETVEGKDDGSDLAIAGPEVSKSMSLAVKKLSDHKLSYEVKNNGKTIVLGAFTVAPDGKTATDVSWAVGKESEKATGFYNKQ